MPIAHKAAALLEVLSPPDMTALPPAARARLAALCRHVADMAEPKPEPTAGVLTDVRRHGVHAE